MIVTLIQKAVQLDPDTRGKHVNCNTLLSGLLKSREKTQQAFIPRVEVTGASALRPRVTITAEKALVRSRIRLSLCNWSGAHLLRV